MASIHLFSWQPKLLLAFGLAGLASLVGAPASGEVVLRQDADGAVRVQTDFLQAEWSAAGALVVNAGSDMVPVVSREASLSRRRSMNRMRLVMSTSRSTRRGLN